MNRLATETSPYLRQHADNPVDWYPWSDEAFERARTEDKPVLVSIGYASCHWCHVMAHESFEDEATAKLMNELFVNVKVDREERPDVDAIYMEATQAMTGSGGWPLTVFVNHDREPFLAGTYFPKDRIGQMPTFGDVIDAVDDAWRNQRDNVMTQADELRTAIDVRTKIVPTDVDIHATGQTLLDHAQAVVIGSHDAQWGGFGSAPKFPQTTALELLLHTNSAPEAVETTLDAMASGGVYDHLGGGFSRYSVDSFWMVPHFEKMLYDQASLTRIYLHAHQVTSKDTYAQVVAETIDYVLRDLHSDNGGFYSSEDADSEGEEGRFYIWRPEEIDATINDAEVAKATKQWFGVTDAGNFEGSNILHRPERGALVRTENVERGRELLFAKRATRVRPGLDDKMLTEWNAMFISALAEAGTALGRREWIDAATTSADFLLSNLRSETGRWQRSWQDGHGAQHLAYANDYAWLIDAFTRLGEATGEARWRKAAHETAMAMVELFWDEADGGFFTTGKDAEQLIVRNKDLFDGATASANSTAAVAFARLSRITGDMSWMKYAERTLVLIAEPMSHHPGAFTNMAIALDLVVTTSATETVIAGDNPEMAQAVQRRYLPRNVLLWGERDSNPLWEGRTDGAYACRGTTCGPVARSTDELLAQLV